MNNKKFGLSLALAAVMGLSACGSDSNRTTGAGDGDIVSGPNGGGLGDGASDGSNGDGQTGNQNPLSILLDTGSAESPKWAYFNFEHGKVVPESGDWDIAVKRMKVKVKDGVKTALVDAQEDFYLNDQPLASAFINADPQFELDNYLATTTVSSAYEDNTLETVIGEEWYIYQGAGKVAHNPASYWVIGSAAANGTFAKMTASNISNVDMPGQDQVATFRFFIQQVGEPMFGDIDSALDVDVNLNQTGMKCVDFESASTIDCTDSAWDVKFDIVSAGRNTQWNIKLNGGESGEGYAKATDVVAENKYSSGSEVISYAFSTDSVASIFSKSSPWQYGADPDNSTAVLPNYRIYALDLGGESKPIKVQFINYYDDMANSGQITMRYMFLEDNGH